MIDKILQSIVKSTEQRLSRRQFICEKLIPSLAIPSFISNVAEGAEDKSSEEIYKTGNLEGECLVGYYIWYTGIKGTVPKEVNVDFKEQLDSLWQRKLKRSSRNVVRQAYESRVKKYLSPSFKPTRMTIEQYLGRIKRSMDDIKQNIDWDKVGSLKRLDSRRQRLVEKISSFLDEKDLLAYAMTELRALSEGQKNIKVMDFLLQNAGMEYVGLIPAIGDDLLLFGPYQFTSYAIYDANGGTRGASIINRALPKEKRIPGSVMYLKGDDHHKAAYLFAIGNIADITRRLDSSQLSTMDSCWKDKKRDIVQYVATAHHCPGDAFTIAKRWLENGAKSDYIISCHGRFIDYAKKTAANYDSLQHIGSGIWETTAKNHSLQTRPVRFGIRYK